MDTNGIKGELDRTQGSQAQFSFQMTVNGGWIVNDRLVNGYLLH